MKSAKTNVSHIEQARADVTFKGKKAIMTLDWEKPSRFYIHVRGSGINTVIDEESDPRAILLAWTRAMKKYAGELVARTPKQRELLQKRDQLAASYSPCFAPSFLRVLRMAELKDIRRGGKTPYQLYFDKKLKEWGIKSPTDLDDAKKKKFFEEVDQGWKSQDETSGQMSRLSSKRQGASLEDLSDHQKIVLLATAGYKSSYPPAGKHYRFYAAWIQTGITVEEWNKAKKELISRKILRANGALSPAAKQMLRGTIGSSELKKLKKPGWSPSIGERTDMAAKLNPSHYGG